MITHTRVHSKSSVFAYMSPAQGKIKSICTSVFRHTRLATVTRPKSDMLTKRVFHPWHSAEHCVRQTREVSFQVATTRCGGGGFRDTRKARSGPITNHAWRLGKQWGLPPLPRGASVVAVVFLYHYSQACHIVSRIYDTVVK